MPSVIITRLVPLVSGLQLKLKRTCFSKSTTVTYIQPIDPLTVDQNNSHAPDCKCLSPVLYMSLSTRVLKQHTSIYMGGSYLLPIPLAAYIYMQYNIYIYSQCLYIYYTHIYVYQLTTLMSLK